MGFKGRADPFLLVFAARTVFSFSLFAFSFSWFSTGMLLRMAIEDFTLFLYLFTEIYCTSYVQAWKENTNIFQIFLKFHAEMCKRPQQKQFIDFPDFFLFDFSRTCF